MQPKKSTKEISENFKNWDDEVLLATLKKGGVVVMPTDTIYGMVGRALDKNVVERIYVARKRAPEKPCIILIGDIKELDKFSITLSEKQKSIFKEYWNFVSQKQPGTLAPGCYYHPTSIIFNCQNERFSYLHRGTKTLAFRVPDYEDLRNLLLKTGPLIAPSANTEALPPAKNISDAKKYFGNLVDLYVDGGTITGKASRVIKLHKDGTTSIIRA